MDVSLANQPTVISFRPIKMSSSASLAITIPVAHNVSECTSMPSPVQEEEAAVVKDNSEYAPLLSPVQDELVVDDRSECVPAPSPVQAPQEEGMPPARYKSLLSLARSAVLKKRGARRSVLLRLAEELTPLCSIFRDTTLELAVRSKDANLVQSVVRYKIPLESIRSVLQDRDLNIANKISMLKTALILADKAQS